MIHIEEMSGFKHKYIERLIDVTVDINCSYHVVLTLLGKGEEKHTLFRQQLLKELKEKKESYTTPYGKK